MESSLAHSFKHLFQKQSTTYMKIVVNSLQFTVQIKKVIPISCFKMQGHNTLSSL